MNTKHSSQFQLETARDGFDYFHIERYISDGYYSHFHRNVELYCVLSGEVSVCVNGKDYELTSGDAVFINSLNIHSYKCNDKAEVIFALLGSKYMQTFYELFPDRLPPILLNDKQANKQMFDYLTSISNKTYHFAPLECYAHTNLILQFIVSAYGTEPKPKNDKKRGSFALAEVIQYIYDNSDSDLSLSSVAKQFNYAPLSLSKLFSQYVKIDIRNFINYVRIQKVLVIRTLPENRGESILELAFRCGFNSVSSFYRAYNKTLKSIAPDSEKQ